ncbi:MAG: peptidoglycan DL-endopeptidase CwlO [Solirubrobacteraceae bacterium]|nr:peptidoglycan DL-endopeptidase CwlO [Solirubrobacteraceae bacterium]
MHGAMPRLLHPLAAALLTAACALAAPAGARGATLAGWDAKQQRQAVQQGLMSPLQDGGFHGDRPLTGAQLRGALAQLAALHAAATVAPPVAPTVSVIGFDALLVRQLGLADVARAVQAEAAHAGLTPPARFGTEVVARLLGLRTNHPFADEDLELYPFQAITRAEAAWSLAQAADFDGSQQQWARDTLARFVLPRYAGRRRAALRVAVARIGMPYVWGGETDRASSALGGQVHGGYDCSGLAWRVFKLGGLPGGAALRGRTAAQQAGEIRRGARLRLSQVRGGDLVFFGPGRFWQKATERRIVHEGIALTPDWMIHASAQGVYVSPLFDPERRASFSWGRRMPGS